MEQDNMKKEFSYRKAFVMSFGIFGILFVWPIFNHYIPLFLQAGNPEYERQMLEAGKEIPKIVGFGLGPTLAFFIMTWDNILNVFLQPWAGLKSDYTRSRFGRRKPWLMIGAPIAALGFVFIPASKTIFAMMIFILITNFGMALFRSPTIAWLGDLFEPEDRNKANGVINFLAGLGGAIAGMVGGLLFDRFGSVAPFIFGAVGMLTFVSLAVLFVREPEVEPIDETEERIGLLEHLKNTLKVENRSTFYVLLTIMLAYTGAGAYGAGASSFAVFTLGIKPGESAFWLTLAGVTFLLFAIPAGLIGSRFDQRKVINVGLIGGIIFLISGYFFVQNLLTYALFYTVVGIFMALVNVNILPMVFNYGDVKKFGANTGMYYFATQTAAIIGPIVAGAVIELTGNNFRMIWPLGAAILVLAIFSLRKVKEKKAMVSV
jgi:maltose/moltooligosaccharide transporter